MKKPLRVFTYDELDLWVHALQPELLAERFAYAVGILRGGAPLALMASHAIGVPVAFLRYDRATRQVAWDSSLPLPDPGRKVLLCEDIAGRGNTLMDCIAFLQQHGLLVKTLCAAYDELSRLRPDWGHDAVGYFASFPWERHAFTEAYRSDWERTGAGLYGQLKDDHEYAVFAIDLDGILLPDIPLDRYNADLANALHERDNLAPHSVPPELDVHKACAIVTGRPESDRARTQAWLDRHGFRGIPLVMRDPTRHADGTEGAVSHKIEAALHLRCTLFIESDPEQAALIAERAPQLRVLWWEATARQGRLIAARSWRVPS